MDAQGPLDLHRRSSSQRRDLAGDRAGRPVLCRGREDGRQALGYVELARAAGPVAPGSTVIAMTDCSRCDAHRARWLAMTPARFPIFAYQNFSNPRTKFAQPEIDVSHFTRLDCCLEYCRGDG